MVKAKRQKSENKKPMERRARSRQIGSMVYGNVLTLGRTAVSTVVPEGYAAITGSAEVIEPRMFNLLQIHGSADHEKVGTDQLPSHFC